VSGCFSSGFSSNPSVVSSLADDSCCFVVGVDVVPFTVAVHHDVVLASLTVRFSYVPVGVC